MEMRQERPRIFISHARADTGTRTADVEKLAEILRTMGFEVTLDTGQWPKGTWRDWMLSGLDPATHILVIGSAEYKRRAAGDGPVGSYGIKTEWDHIDELMTHRNAQMATHKRSFVPVSLLTDFSLEHFPSGLEALGRPHFVITELTADGVSESGLRDFILDTFADTPTAPESAGSPATGPTGQPPAAARPPAGPPGTGDPAPGDPGRIAAEFDRALTLKGRQQALAEIAGWLRDPADRRSRVVTGGSGSGKTALLGVVAHLDRG
jgi:hypothetical protein